MTSADAPAIHAPCAERAAVVAELARYKETPAMRALTDGGQVIEIFASPTGSWTAVTTRPDGTSCVLSVGTGFEAMAWGEGL